MDAFDPFGSDDSPPGTNLLAPVIGGGLNQGTSPLAAPLAPSAASAEASSDLPSPIFPMGVPTASSGEATLGRNTSSTTSGEAGNRDYSTISSGEPFSTVQSVFPQNESSVNENNFAGAEAVAAVTAGDPIYNYDTASFEESPKPFADSNTAVGISGEFPPPGNFANFEANLAPAEIVQTNPVAGLIDGNKVSIEQVWSKFEPRRPDGN